MCSSAAFNSRRKSLPLLFYVDELFYVLGVSGPFEVGIYFSLKEVSVCSCHVD